MATEKKRAINRLRTMHPLRAKVDEAYARSVEAMKAGKPTAWAMVNWWAADPVFKAMDMEILYPENYGAVCAASGVAESYLDGSEQEGHPNHLCGYSRNCFGYAKRMMKDLGGQIPPEAPLGGMPKPVLLLSHGIACDARVKWFQGLGHYMDVPVWMMETVTPGVEEFFMDGVLDRAVDFMAKEYREFISFMERLLGRKLDWARYEEVVDDTIEMSRVWHEVNELRKAKPCPMHSRDFFSSMPPNLFMAGDTKEVTRLYRDMYEEMKYRVENGVGAVDPERYRLAFADLPPWHSLGFFDRLAERGWNFVIETPAYHPPIPVEGIEAITDPVRRHARFHLAFLIRYLEKAYQAKIYLGIAYPYLEYARDYRCDGLFAHPLMTCRSASLHHPALRTILLHRLKVPSITEEGDIVDLRLFNAERALRDCEAFEETMDHYKESRSREGFDW
jgi:benzoyl-CoA reductase subunit B